MEFIDFKIKNIAKVTAGGDKPKICSDVYSDETPIPIFSNGMDNDGLYGYTNQSKIEGDTVTISARGVNVGTVCYREKPFLPIVRLLSLIPDRNIISAKYLYYYLKTVNISGTGSAQPQVTVPMISDLQVHIHKDLSEQNKIALLLSAFDQKIKKNNQINRNLSEQSQMIVKSYMESKEYNMTPLADIAEVIDCLHSKKPEAKEDGTKQLIQLDNITDAGFLDMDKLKYMISDDDYAFWIRKCEIIAGDCVITNVGRVGAVSQAPAGTHAAMGRNMTCIRLKKQYEWQAYLITMLLSDHMKSEISKNTDVGTIMNALNVKDIPKLQFPVFSENDMEKLEGDLKSIRGMIETNYLENQRLTKIRDALLPKLMSGELDVSDLKL